LVVAGLGEGCLFGQNWTERTKTLRSVDHSVLGGGRRRGLERLIWEQACL